MAESCKTSHYILIKENKKLILHTFHTLLPKSVKCTFQHTETKLKYRDCAKILQQARCLFIYGCKPGSSRRKDPLYTFFLYIYIISYAHAHRGYGIDHAIGDLILPHVLDHIKLSCSLFGDDLVSNFLQFRVKLLKKIFKQQRKELEKEERDQCH